MTELDLTSGRSAPQAEPVERLIDRISLEFKQDLRACYPRDNLQQVRWTARCPREESVIDDTSLELACLSYFVPR